MPIDSCMAEKLVERLHRALNDDVALVAERAEEPDESMNVSVTLAQAPVEPADLGVLAIRVVVAALRPAHLVAHQQHGRADGQQVQREKILDLAVAERLDRRIA